MGVQILRCTQDDPEEETSLFLLPLFDWKNSEVFADFLGEDIDNLGMAWNGGPLV